MNLPPEILTDRLRLRPAVAEDALDIFERYAHDPVVCRYLNWRPHRSLDDTRAYLAKGLVRGTAESIHGYLVFDRKFGRLLGSIGGTVQATRMQFGYCLAQDAWGQGVATEAVRAFVAAVMEEGAIWRMQAYCDIENKASARVLEKCGLILEGTLRRFMVLPNLGEKPRDVYCFAIVHD